MSTQINVTVGSGGLPEKAKLQQQAARQAQLEKERQRRVEAQGQEQRNAALTAEGRAPDGSVLSSGKTKQPLAQPRPAAFRSDNLPDVGTMWDFYSYGGPAVTLGNLGWRARSITIPAAEVRYFPDSNFITQSYNNTIACGSGKEHQTITTERPDLTGIFMEGTKSPAITIDGYNYSLPPNPFYYLEYKAYFFNVTAIGGVTSSIFADTTILPTGKDSAIYIYFTRNTSSLRKYNMGAYYIDYYTSSGAYSFTVPSTPTQIDGGPTTHLGAPTDGVFTAYDSNGNLVTYTVPKLFSGFSIDLGYSESFRAFAVNKNKIREITFPEYFKNKILSKWPLKYQQVTDNLYSDVQYVATDYAFSNLNGDWFSARLDDITGFGNLIAVTDYSEISIATPEIFSKINTDIVFTSPANIKTFDFSKYRVIVQDRSSGMFTAYANGTCSNDFSFQDYSLSDVTVKDLYATAEYIDFAVWKNPGESADYSIFNTSGCPITPSLPQVVKNKKARTQMFPGRPAAPEFPIYGDASLIAITDGGDPSYCRSMCLALGFTEADLTP